MLTINSTARDDVTWYGTPLRITAPLGGESTDDFDVFFGVNLSKLLHNKTAN